MPQSRAVRFEAIGHPDARLGGLRLDFCAAGAPTHTAMWLRNGGGKSSILSILFTTLAPNLRDFLGGKGSQRRSLEDVVLTGDTGHVAVEWGMEDGRRIVIGCVLEKQRRGEVVRPGPLRWWYSFRSDVLGGPALDDLPVRDAERRVRRNAAAFLDALHAASLHAPACEYFKTDNQARWLDYLARAGLDPELFRYQLEMNQREGGAEELFAQVESAAKLVNLVLRLAMGSDDASRVADNIGRFAKELANKPRYELEAAFLESIGARLALLAEAVGDSDAAELAVEEARGAAGALRDRLAAAVRAAGVQAAAAAAQAEEKRPEYLESVRRGDRLRDLAREAGLAAAELRLAEAEAAHSEAKGRAAEAGEEALAWEAAVQTARLRVADADAAEAQRAIDEATVAARPLRDELESVGRDLAGMVAALEQKAREEAEEAEGRRDRSKEDEDGAHQEARDREGERATAESALKGVRTATARFDTARAELVDAGGVGESESMADASARLAREAETLAEAVRTDERRRAEAETAAAGAREEAADRHRQADAAAEQAREQREERVAKQEEANRLAADPTVVAAAGVEPPVPLWSLADRLPGLLRDAARRQGWDLVELEVDAADDRRAAAALRDRGLLPARRDVEAVLAALHAAEVPAVSGWRWLFMHRSPDARRDVADRRPELSDGVIVTDPSRFEAARRELALAAPAVSGPVVVALAEGFDHDGAGPRIVVDAPGALFDEQQAEEELVAREARLADVDERRHSLESGQHDCLRLADQVDAFLVACPPGRLESLAHEIAALEQEAADRRADAETAERQAVRHQAERERLERRLGEERARQLDVAGLRTRVDALLTEEEALAAGPSEAALVTRITGAETARDAALAAADQARQAWAEAEGARARSVQAAERRAEEGGEIAGELGAALGEVTPTSPDDYGEVRRRFDLLVERYRGMVGHDALAERKRSAERRAEEHRRELAGERLHSVADRGAALAGSAGNDPSACGDRMHHAREAAQAEGQAAARLEAPVVAARQALGALEPAGVRRGLLAADGLSMPATAAAAQDMADRLGAESTAAYSRAQELRNDIDRLNDVAAASENLGRLLGAQAQRLADRVGAGDDEGQAPDPGSPPWDHDLATHAVDGVISLLSEADDAASAARQRVGESLRALRAIAGSAAFDDVKGRLRERLRDDDAVLAAHAADYAAEASTRLTGLRTHLADLATHEDQLVEELCGLVGTAQSLLRRAQSASRLPDDPRLEEWAGQEFVRLRFTIPRRAEGLADRMRELVAEIVAEGRIPPGGALLEKAVHAAAGRAGFAAVLLKPSATMERREVAVEEIATASGGERLTAALLLFFVLVRLRAPRFGLLRPTYTMFADNPIGTCSSIRLLELQRRVADSFGVQLVYATGVNDLDALDMLPKVIRMRNEHVDPRTRHHHVTIDDEEIGRRRVAATEVFRYAEGDDAS